MAYNFAHGPDKSKYGWSGGEDGLRAALVAAAAASPGEDGWFLSTVHVLAWAAVAKGDRRYDNRWYEAFQPGEEAGHGEFFHICPDCLGAACADIMALGYGESGVWEPLRHRDSEYDASGEDTLETRHYTCDYCRECECTRPLSWRIA